LYLGLALEQQKKYAQAEPFLKEAIDLRTAGGAGATWETAYARNALGACLGAQGKYPEGAPLVLESIKTLEESTGTPAVHVQKARKRTEEFLAAWSRRNPREAEEARKSIKPAAEISAATP
jgi:tetratricopeptide (TPR) repeat protein